MGVLENINIHDGSGNSLTSTSNALDVNLKTSAATVTVAQPTGSDLHTVVDSGTLTSITDPVTVVQPTAANLNATVRAQDGSGNPLTSTDSALDSNLKTIGGTAVQTGTGGSGAGIPRVTVADDSKVQPWDGTNSAKFDATGEQTIDITRFGGATVQLGQSNMAHSIPVAFASDQQLAVSGVYNNQTGTVTSGTVPTTQDGTLSLVNDVFTWSTLVLNFVLTFGEVLSLGGTFQVEGSVDGNTWTALTGTLLSDTPEQVTEYTTTGFVTCSSRYNLAGFPWIRLRTTQPFTGTINVQQCLTTAQGDEVGFTTSRIVDDSGNSVDLTPAAQYTEGQSPQAIYFQGGQTNLAAFPESQVAIPADAVYVLPKRSQIGNTLVIAVIVEGTGLTAANLAPMWLEDTAGSIYTLAQLYDSTVTSAGQAIALYVRTITAVDNEGQIGLMLGFGGTIGTGQPITSITGINILVHEYSGVVVPGDSFAHVMTPANTSGAVSAPIAPYVGYLIYSLVSSQTAQELSMNRLSTGPYTGAAPYPVESCTGDNVASFTLSTAWDWVCVKLPIATTGQVMMGRLTGGDGDGPIQAIKIDPASGGVLAAVTNDPSSPLSVQVTNPVAISSASPLPVALNSGETALTNTGGSLNVNLTNPAIPVTQSGTWTLTATNPSVGSTQAALPGEATVMGVASSANGTLQVPVMDANSGLRVSVAAGSASTNPAASATGSAVPADASYTGFDNGGDLVGVSSNNPLPVAVLVGGNTQYAESTIAGSPTGTVAMGLGSDNGIRALSTDVSGHLNANIVNTPSVTISGTATVAISGTPTVTGTVTSKTQDGAGNALTSTGGSLNVNVTGGSASGVQYATGAAVTTPTGTVAMGTDGEDVRALSTTSTGALNVVAAPVAVTGANGASVEAAQSTTAPAHVLQVGGVYNSTPPNISSGDITALQTDGNGSLKVSLAGTSVIPLVQIQSSGTNLTNTDGALNVNVANNPNTNGAAAATGSAVPADASYTGFNSGGDLVGVSSTNPLPVTVVGGGGGGGDVQYSSGQLSGANTTGTVAMGAYGSGAATYAVPLSVSSTGVLKVDGSGVTQNSVNLPSTAAGSALSAKFINNTGAAISVKASAGNLYGFSLTNSTAAPAFVEFFNTSSAPTLGTSGVVFCVVIPASGNVTINPTTMGLMNFSTGIGFAATTTENGTTTAAVTGMLFYA